MQQCRFPKAMAQIRGAGVTGRVAFYQQCGGVMVMAQIDGLPRDGFFALHIHEGGSCTGAGFSDTGGHFNPGGGVHPDHAGDLPPLLSNRGRAKMTVLTGRFRVEEIISKTVVIHSGVDDFTSQPAGNAGVKIACGVIRKMS